MPITVGEKQITVCESLSKYYEGQNYIDMLKLSPELLLGNKTVIAELVEQNDKMLIKNTPVI